MSNTFACRSAFLLLGSRIQERESMEADARGVADADVNDNHPRIH